jgi:hypothetical protein
MKDLPLPTMLLLPLAFRERMGLLSFVPKLSLTYLSLTVHERTGIKLFTNTTLGPKMTQGSHEIHHVPTLWQVTLCPGPFSHPNPTFHPYYHFQPTTDHEL